MNGLLIKDMRILGQQKKIILMILALSVFLNFEMESSYVITYLTFVCGFLAMSVPTLDEADNGYAFLFTLPIKRTTYILETYVFGILVVGIAGLAGTGISMVFYMARGQMDTCLEGMLQAWLMFPLVLLLLSVTYPVQFKYGTEKCRVALLCIIGCIMAIGYIGLRLVASAGIDIRPMHEWVKGHFVWTEVLAWAGGLLIYVISGFISAAVMNKKEY